MVFPTAFFQNVQADVVMLKIIHLVQGCICKQAQKSSQSSAMHANQNGRFLQGFNFFEPQSLSFQHCIWRFSAIDSHVEFAVSPFCEHLIEFTSGMFARMLAFQNSPINLIEFWNYLGFDVQFFKWSYCLMGALERADKYLLKWNVLVGLIECIGLCNSLVVDVRVNPGTLYNTQFIVVRFTMPNDIHCFCGLGG